MSSNPEMQFPEVWRNLCNARRTNRVGHAYCFVGDDPQLLEEFGRRWAQVCICPTPAANGESCGECPTCKRFKQGVCSQFFELRPQSKSRRILVDEIRDFEHSMQLSTGGGRNKAGMILEADRLVVQAQNAFLKTLEEPPRNVILILLTTQPRSLLPTIRSRCQMISVRTNRKKYDTAVVKGIFPLLARLHRGAGSAVALATAHQLCWQFAALHDAAANNVESGLAPETSAEVEQDPQLQKRFEEAYQARLQAEYLRLRQEVVEAIQIWFLHQSLLAHGAPINYIPNPEIFEPADYDPATARIPERGEAKENVGYARELAYDFARNVDERLALESFCLTVCKHFSN